MKLSELKTRLKNKYVVRIVAGVLTIALLGSSMTAVAVQADQKKDAAVQTEQKEDSSDKKDDIEFQHQIMGGNAFHHLVHRYLRLENAGFRKYPESRIEPCKGWRYRTDARSV